MSSEFENLVQQYAVIWVHQVQFWEMDVAFHVNNVHYFRWFENARVQYMERIGEMNRFFTEGLGLVVGYQDCKNIAPVSYPDKVHVGVSVRDLQTHKMTMNAKMVSEKTKGVVALLSAQLVAYDLKERRKTELSQDLVSKILVLEKR
jgi:acyl-CoA thioester hydrolase